jgi:MYXO-CTERM domain-containing protein
MLKARVLVGAMLLTAPVFAQPVPTNPNPNPEVYPPNTYNRPVEVRTGYGNWGLLGLLGLTGLLGLRRRETIARGRDEYLDEQRRRVA